MILGLLFDFWAFASVVASEASVGQLDAVCKLFLEIVSAGRLAGDSVGAIESCNELLSSAVRATCQMQTPPTTPAMVAVANAARCVATNTPGLDGASAAACRICVVVSGFEGA